MPRELDRVAYQRYAALLGIAPDESLSPEQRGAAIPAWCTPLLIETTAARNKLRAWVRTTPRDQWAVDPDPATVLLSLAVFGDPIVPHVLAKTLCLLPAPVRAYVTQRVTWLGVGYAFNGWCGARPDFGDRPFMIVLARTAGLVDDVRFAGLIAHESVHAWRFDEPPTGTTLRPAFADWTIHSTPLDQVPADVRDRVIAMRAEAEREERQVRATAREWGFVDLS
jgi:hypothetical protein